MAGILPDLETEIVKRSDRVKGFVVQPRRWVVERTIAWLNRCRQLAKDWENLNRNALAFIKLASIRSCSENSVILHKVSGRTLNNRPKTNYVALQCTNAESGPYGTPSEPGQPAAGHSSPGGRGEAAHTLPVARLVGGDRKRGRSSRLHRNRRQQRCGGDPHCRALQQRNLKFRPQGAIEQGRSHLLPRSTLYAGVLRERCRRSRGIARRLLCVSR